MKISVFSSILLINTVCSAQKIEKTARVDDIHFKVQINLSFAHNDSGVLEVTDTDSIYYDEAVLRLPENYSSTGKPVRLVYLAHGAGGGVTDSSWFFNNYSLPDSLLKNGYACFDVNGGPSVQNMGGSRVVQSAFKAYEYIRQHYNVYDKILVGGFSMGGLSSTNFVYKHSNIVLAHAMYSPVLDLYKQAWQNPWSKTTRKAIATAFDFEDKTGERWDSSMIIGWNPLLNNTFNNGLDTFKIYPVPVKIWHATYDRTVEIESSRNFQKYIENAGGYCELREMNSNKHGLSGGAAFMNRELVLFYNRFN